VKTAPNPSTKDDISAWSLIRPYWVSEDRWVALGLLIVIIAINMVLVYINVRLNAWQKTLYDVLTAKSAGGFKSALTEFTVLAMSFIALSTVRVNLRQKLEFRWRQWLTVRYLTGWLGNTAYYRIERDRLTDNPDQRIADDLQSLATDTLTLSLDLLSTIVTLVSFTTILWALSGALSITLLGHPLTIPGYMFWAAVFYALLGSWIMQKTNRPLISVNYQQQRVEADFRFGLIRLRENAEQIAFYDGSATESQALQGRFGKIRDNWQQIIKFTRRLTLVTSFYGQIAIIFPLMVAAPRYFSGAYTIGILFQISDAFSSVTDSLSWFIYSYASLAGWRATVNRLREFQRVMRTPEWAESVSPATAHGGIHRHLNDTGTLTTRALKLARPDGTAMVSVGEMGIAPGSRWLIQGPSGTGKSTLMRALAGLWPFGEGAIDIPVDAHIMFLPQRSYIPIGTLKEALCYPSAGDAFSDEACRAALVDAQLAQYAEHLTDQAHWEQRMSPGEQQRLAFARVLLQQPDFLLLDEASSALDSDTERTLYETVIARLPKTALVSIAHRTSLREFHEHLIELAQAA